MVQVQEFETGTRYGLEIFHQCDEKFNTKSQKVLEDNSVLEVTGEKMVVGPFPPTILNMVRSL